MSPHPLAGKPAPKEMLVNIPLLVSNYYSRNIDLENVCEYVRFGTSGHRGTSLKGTFNEYHVLAICQAISDYRKAMGITGPLFIGKDTHALSEPALITSIEVFAANGVHIRTQSNGGYTPTPVISHSILSFNRGKQTGFADGVVITPSHNPPQDGGLKYNSPSGGPADSNVTAIIQERANALLREGLKSVKRIPYERAISLGTTLEMDFVSGYVMGLSSVIDMPAISNSGLSIGVDPMGGSGIAYWGPISDMYGLNLNVVNKKVDPTFSFMPVDNDGKIRMDCSSANSMSKLIDLKDSFDISFANDPDFDRHGIVTKSAGLLNPNQYLSAASEYLFTNRPKWKSSVGLGKTLVTSSMVDRVAKSLDRPMIEMPVGFKWFVDGLKEGYLGLAGEESAGASFLRFDGSVWSTDKDGIIMNLLSAEITAVMGKDPGEVYSALEQRFGSPIYQRLDAPATETQKLKLQTLSPDQVSATELAGEAILSKITEAPGNCASIGGLKVITENGWFAARPSGTEDIYKIYAESFIGPDHLSQVQAEAKALVDKTISGLV